MDRLRYSPLVAVPRSIGLYVGGRVKFQQKHLDDMLLREDGRPFKIFREVIITPGKEYPAHPSGIFRVWFYARGSTTFTKTLVHSGVNKAAVLTRGEGAVRLRKNNYLGRKVCAVQNLRRSN